MRLDVARRAATAPLALGARRLASDVPFAVSLFAAVAATAFLFAYAPQWFDAMAERSLEQTVAEANPLERDLVINGAGRIDAAPGGDPLGSVAEVGRTYAADLPASFRAVVGPHTATLETVRFTIVVPPGRPEPGGTTRYVTLRHLDRAFERVRVVEGALPSDRAGPVELPFRGVEQEAATGIEIALSEETAEQLSVGVGDLLFAVPAADDSLVRRVPVVDRRYLALTVAGIVAAAPGQDEWLQGSRLGRAAIRDTETRRFVYGYALFDPAAYNAVLSGVFPLPLRYEWRYPVDPAAVARSDAAQLADDVRRLFASVGETTFAQRLGFGARTGLARILEQFGSERRAAAAVLALAAAALLGVALAVLGVLAGLAAERRTEAIQLLRSRGASLPQTLAVQAVEALLVAAPAGALGLAAATLASGRPPAPAHLAVVLAIVAAAGALVAGLALGPARRALSARERADTVVPRLTPLRLGLEGFAVVAALAGAYLLRRRGLSAEGGFDPYLAAVPVLVGLAAALVVLRLYPLPLRALAWAAAPRRDLVPALALRRLARQPSGVAAPLLVVLLASAVAVFVATLAATVAAAQDHADAARLTPLDASALDAFAAGAAVACAYAAVALLLGPVLSARTRLRDFAYLRALGLAPGDVRRLAAFELGPPVAAALAAGLPLGLVLAHLVAPAVDLGALAAGERAPLRPALGDVALVAAALLLVTAVSALLTGAAARRVRLDRVLRMGER